MTDNSRYRVRIPNADSFKELVPCQAACPVHTDAGHYVQLIAQGEYEQAYLTACSPNPFASVCGDLREQTLTSQRVLLALR